MQSFKFKDLKNLGNQISTMCLFAEQIKAKVNNDLGQIQTAKTFINSVQETLEDMYKTRRKREDPSKASRPITVSINLPPIFFLLL